MTVTESPKAKVAAILDANTAAAVYCRISNDPEGLRAGVERQEQDCREWVEKHGLTLADVYVDNDISAYSGKPRPDYTRLLEDAKSGKFKTIVIWHPDRLHRSPTELEEFITLVEQTKCGVGCVTTGGLYDLTTSDGVMHARIVGAVARNESDRKAERVRRAFQQQAEQGHPHRGGYRPFGYDADKVTIRESEAVIIREMANRALQGESLGNLARELNVRGVATSVGKKWSRTTIGNVLTSPHNAGKRRHRLNIHQGTWPAILEEDIWRGLCAMFPTYWDRGNQTGQPSHRFRSLLGGLIYCGICNQRMNASASAGAKSYRCSGAPDRGEGCGGVSRNRDKVDAFVLSAALAQASLDRVEGPPSDSQMIALQTQLDRLDEVYLVEGKLTEARWRTMRAKVELKISTALLDLSQAVKAPVKREWVDTGIVGWWETATPQQRRDMLQRHIEKVVVLPTHRGNRTVDERTITIHWR